MDNENFDDNLLLLLAFIQTAPPENAYYIFDAVLENESKFGESQGRWNMDKEIQNGTDCDDGSCIECGFEDQGENSDYCDECFINVYHDDL